MHLLHRFSSLVVLGAILLSCNHNPQTDKNMNDQAVLAANDKFYSALNSMFSGDFGPMDSIWSHADNITYMGPFGGKLVGWDSVGADFQQVTNMKLGGHIAAEGVSVISGAEMASVACTEVGVNVDPSGKSVEVRHRATNIFRLEQGTWKLVHHHTDIAQQLESAFDKVIE